MNIITILFHSSRHKAPNEVLHPVKMLINYPISKMGTIMAVDIIVYRTQVLWLKLGACSVSEHISPFYPDQVNGLSVKSASRTVVVQFA